MKKLCVLMAAMLAGSVLYADGGQSRPIRPAEKSFIESTLSALAKTLPAPFDGFRFEEGGEVSAPDAVDVGAENYPMRLLYTVTWNNDEMEKKAAEKTKTLGNKMVDDREHNPGTKAKMSKKDKITAKMDQAAARQDYKELERLAAELGALSDEMTGAYETDMKKIDDIKYSARIVFTVNELHSELNGSGYSLRNPVQGCTVIAYKDPAGESTSRLMIFAGNWQKRTTNGQIIMEAAPRKVPSTTAQAVILTITGDLAFAEKIVQKTSWQQIKALIK